MQGFYRVFGKRVLDVVLSTAALVLLSPAASVVALAIRICMGSPVIFRQVRPGLHGRPFTLYKFRTMLDVQDEHGNPLPDKQRLTRLGRLIRILSLDEIPQLWNVLKGDMSLVGPRPLLLRYEPYFTCEERLRFQVRPGITGLGLILGRNDLAWDERLAADVRYVKELSVLLDVRILMLTVWRVLTRAGLQVDPGAVMEDLDVQRSRAVTQGVESTELTQREGPGSVTVRPASVSDAGPIHRIITSALSPRLLSYTIYQSPLSVNYLRQLLSDRAAHPADSLVVAECAGETVGCYHAIKRSEDYFLNYIAIAPAMQGKGLGLALFRHFEQLGSEIGYKLFALDVFESNARAVSWYASQGYQQAGATYWCQLAAPPVCARPSRLELASDALERAIREEAAVGFSKVECSCSGGRLVVGLIAGRICKLLHYEGLTLEEAASSVLETLYPERETLLITGVREIPTYWPVLSYDRVLRLQKEV